MKKYLNFNITNSILELIHIKLVTVTHIMNPSFNVAHIVSFKNDIVLNDSSFSFIKKLVHIEKK